MIVGKTTELNRYLGINKNLDTAIRHIESLETLVQPLGKYYIENEDVFFMSQEYTTKDFHEGNFETHKKYLDIQIVAEGEEHIGYTYLSALDEIQEYNEEKDVAKQKGTVDVLIPLNEGSFAIFFPGEFHSPGLLNQKKSNVKKLVYKVKM